jgi:hypothetical protein
MLYRRNLRQSLTVLALSGALALGTGDGKHAIAHQVQTSADIGGTVHIEPNDAPRAGESTVAWFALTRRGGTSVPLSACDCELTLYASSEGAIATPPLTPLSVERYENIPSATVTFPAVGQYELVMTGRPVTAGDFQPFELRFPVTVATVAPTAAPSPPSAQLSTPEASEPPTLTDNPPSPRLAIALVPALIIGLGLGLLLLRRAKPSSNDGDLEL